MSPVFATLAEQKDYSHMKFLKVDVDDVQGLGDRCGISAIPTFQVYKAGEKVGEVNNDPNGLKKLLDKYRLPNDLLFSLVRY